MTDREKLLLAGLGAVALLYLVMRRDAVVETASNVITQAEETAMEYAKAVSDFGRSLVRRFEGLSLTAYPDAGGYSIGYGHYMGVKPTMQAVTEEQAESLLANDLSHVDSLIRRYVKVPLTQGQHDAIASAAYNLGAALFWSASRKAPTHFLDALNAGDYQGAADLLLTFNHSQGKENPVLTARRQEERALFLS